ncbi:MAG: T9SS type A sorting domain-containing protein [Chlorobi bacterium]|nr:T9SS type A sorting domain-containing protein [Chlorobiota bacterium]
MKKTLFLLIYIFVSASGVAAQDFVFFSDSQTAVSYDPSWGFANQPSVLERVGDKFPVAENIKYQGTNSLKLSWLSAEGGDWGIAVAEPGWPGHDVTTKDSLSFWVFSESETESADLPIIYLEDINNKKTDKQNLSDYSQNIPANEWIKISIPLEIFIAYPGEADLTKIKTIFYGQGAADNVNHTLYLDEIRMTDANENDVDPPDVPEILYAKGYSKHIDVKWNGNDEEDLAGYYIYKINDGSEELVGTADKDEIYYSHFLGQFGITAEYAVSAFDQSGNESALSATVSATTRELNDDEELDMLQEATFRYFWDYAHPVSGMSRERTGSGNIVTSGGTGMGLMAIIVGIERGFVSRETGAARTLKIINFLKNADRFHGAWSHWLDGETGKAIPFSQFDDGGDLVETAYLVSGLLTAREYFNKDNVSENEIRELATQLWEEVEWDWYRKSENGQVLYWHWSPNYGWQMNHQIRGFNEAMIVYLLAVASPTHSVPADLYHSGWAGGGYENGKTFYGIKLDVGPDYGGPLFFVHYSFLGFDPRDKKDAYANYFTHAKNVALVHQKYAIENPQGFAGYDESNWGLTASDDPLVGYTAHAPVYNDNGTITPTAALSSFPFVPEEAMKAFKSFYNNYGETLWGSFGFRDAFNPGLNWTAGDYLAIDQGPIIIMIENYRTRLIWNLFMSNPEIAPALAAIGFEDVTGVPEDTPELNFKLYDNYPNPFNPDTIIEYSLPRKMYARLLIYDALGRKVAALVDGEIPAGKHKAVWNASGRSSGVYFYKLTAENYLQTKKMLYVK